MGVRFSSAALTLRLVLPAIFCIPQLTQNGAYVDPVAGIYGDVARLSPVEMTILQKRAQSGDAESELKFGVACQTRYDALGIPFAEGQRRSVEWFEKAANQNNALGQRMFAASLAGKWSEMREWYERAAQQGDIPSAYSLGQLYIDGDVSGKPDPSQAARWFLVAAKGGEIEAAFKLACFYETGIGIDRDAGEAANWYRRAAEHDWKPAQYKLGTLYEHGVGVSQDLEEAARWYEKAADGSGDAAYGYARLVASQQIRGKTTKDAQIMFRHAAKLFQSDAKLGDPAAAQKLARMFEVGTGVAQSYSEAFFWYSVALAADADVGADISRVKSHLTVAQIDILRKRLDKWEAAF